MTSPFMRTVANMRKTAQQQQQPESAARAYHRERADFAALVVALKKATTKHAKRQERNSFNWEYVGDLTHVNALLRDALDAIR